MIVIEFVILFSTYSVCSSDSVSEAVNEFCFNFDNLVDLSSL